MTNLRELEAYGFRVNEKLKSIIAKLPDLEIVRIDEKEGVRIAKIYIDKETDIIITQKF